MWIVFFILCIVLLWDFDLEQISFHRTSGNQGNLRPRGAGLGDLRPLGPELGNNRPLRQELLAQGTSQSRPTARETSRSRPTARGDQWCSVWKFILQLVELQRFFLLQDPSRFKTKKINRNAVVQIQHFKLENESSETP